MSTWAGRPEQQRPYSRHPGWPARPGPLRVRAGEVQLRPVRLRDGGAWSTAKTRDEEQLRPWEPTGIGSWAARHHTTSWPGVCTSLRASARRGALLPFVIELDGRFAGQLTIGNVVRGALRSAWIGYWVATPVTGGLIFGMLSNPEAGKPGQARPRLGIRRQTQGRPGQSRQGPRGGRRR